MTKGKKKIKKRKLNKKRFFLVFIIFISLVIVGYKLFNTNIKNIYISGNEYLSDQEIIDISGLKDYPKSINNLSYNVEKKLESNKYILKATVKKNNFLRTVYIDVKENYPLFGNWRTGST